MNIKLGEKYQENKILREKCFIPGFLPMEEFTKIYIINLGFQIMKLGVLFSGGKDSTFATWLAKKEGYEISCLISIVSDNKESYMFHTPAIEKTEVQARSMNIPIILQKTEGKKEKELEDLKEAIKKAKEKYEIQGIVTGAIQSVYQASRIQ